MITRQARGMIISAAFSASIQGIKVLWRSNGAQSLRLAL